jgi:enoyl-CoA hydratase/carnithine racemase
MTALDKLEHTRYSVVDGVATVTLNRPDKMNAWTGTMDAEV